MGTSSSSSSSSFVLVETRDAGIIRDREDPLATFDYKSEPLHIAYNRLTKLFSLHLKDTEEEFRRHLEESGIVAACSHIRRVGKVPGIPFRNFVRHLDACMIILQSDGRRDLLLVLMELYIPIDVYSQHMEEWVKNSDLKLIKLFLQQGHTIRDMNGNFGNHVVRHGRIDVLDFFLALEDAEAQNASSISGAGEKGEGKKDGERRGERKQIFHPDIVYDACGYKNVDVLDRILVRGYAINVPYTGSGNLPFHAAIKGKNSLPVLDRLIMYGLDVNSRAEYNFSRIFSPLTFSLACQNYECFDRLLDVGSCVDNEIDIPIIFTLPCLDREVLLKLVKAGLDLHYRTSEGTPLEIIERMIVSHNEYLYRHQYANLALPYTLGECRRVETLVRDMTAEQEKKGE